MVGRDGEAYGWAQFATVPLIALIFTRSSTSVRRGEPRIRPVLPFVSTRPPCVSIRFLFAAQPFPKTAPTLLRSPYIEHVFSFRSMQNER